MSTKNIHQKLLAAIQLVLLLFSVGCTNTIGDVLAVSDAFTEGERASIATALDEWYVATDGGVDIQAGIYSATAIGPASLNNMRWVMRLGEVEDRDSEVTSAAETDFLVRSIVIDRSAINELDARLPDKDAFAIFRSIVIHEIWHAVTGELGHTESSAILSEDVSDFCIDQPAVDAMCKEVDCGPDAKSTCDEQEPVTAESEES